MISLILAQSSFFLMKHFFSSGLAFTLAFLTYQARKISEKDQNNIVTQEGHYFLSLTLFSASTQLIFHFIYPFTFLLYLQSFFFMFGLISYGQIVFFRNFNSKEKQEMIFKGVIFLYCLALLYFILQLFQIKSLNQCGQNKWKSFSVFEFLVLVAVIWAQGNLLLNALYTPIDLRCSFDPQGKGESLIQNIVNDKESYQGMLIILTTGGLVHLFFNFLFFSEYDKTQKCSSLLTQKAFVLQGVFAVFSSISENFLNIGFYWLYFWRVKNELKVFGLEVVNTQEAYNSMRSIKLKDVNSKQKEIFNQLNKLSLVIMGLKGSEVVSSVDHEV